MPFGSLRGTFTGNGNSVGASNNLSGSAAVIAGDLVYVVFGQQTNLTATGVTDNLGNTYTAQNAGTDAGTATGRAFWARVTNPGTLTTVTVAASSSTNDFAGVAIALAGPLIVSPVDTNPANNNNTDNASPFTCPATGTLAQSQELVLAWMIGDGSATWSATSPNLKGTQANNVNNINVIVGYQAVNSTSTVSPEFTGTNPTVSVQGTQSFKADTTVPEVNIYYPTWLQYINLYYPWLAQPIAVPESFSTLSSNPFFTSLKSLSYPDDTIWSWQPQNFIRTEETPPPPSEDKVDRIVIVPSPLYPPMWIGQPIGINADLFFTEPSSPTIPRLWRWDNVPDPVWTWTAPSALSQYIPQTNPFFKLWRSDYVPFPVWTWGAPPALAPYLPQVIVFPFSKLWRSDYVSPSVWNWQAPPTLAPNLGTPFAKLWRYDYVPPSSWTWTGTSAKASYLPTLQPFSKLWRYDFVTTPVWTWAGTSSKTAYLPVTNPFHKLWRSDYVAAPDWTWKAPRSYQIYMPTVVTFFGAQGQAPTRQWHYDFVPDPVWQGKPIKARTGIFGPTPVLPEEDFSRPFKFERRKIWSSRLPTLTRLR